MSKPKPHKIDAPQQETAAAERAAAAQEPGTEASAADRAAAAAATADALELLRADLAQVNSEMDAARDRALRAQADLDNYRKRVHRQMEEERRYAEIPLLRDLLPVLDNLHRAIEAADKSPDPAVLLEGLKLVASQLEGVLQRHHCTPIEALHAPFDPHRHEAIAQQPSQNHPPNTVLLVTQRGFQLHDRVVRPCQVIVSASDSQPDNPQ